MIRQVDVVVATDIVEKIMKQYLISQASGTFKRLIWNGEQATGIFERGASRFHLTLTRVVESDVYIVAVPNFFVCMETTNPKSCGNKISERDISAIDAESIELGIRYMKKIMDECREEEAKDARTQLVIAYSHIQNALKIIAESNQTGTQMDYVTHPSLSNVFDEVWKTAMRVNDYIYQKKK
jgi:hypothetical protein